MSVAVACSLLLCTAVPLSVALPPAALTSRDTHSTAHHSGQSHDHTSPHVTDRELGTSSKSEGNFTPRDSYRNRAMQDLLPTGLERSQKPSESHAPVCGDGYCYCYTDTYADCSGHEAGLRYIPSLPDTIRELNFARNKLTSIDNDQFFINVSGVTALDLTFNNITFITFEALNFLKNLTRLWLDKNTHFSLQSLKALFSIPTLQELTLSETHLGPALPADVVPKYPKLKLHTLKLDGNRFSSLNLSLLTPLAEMKTIDLTGNSIGYELTTDYLRSLKTLFLGSTSLHEFPQTCRNGTSLFPRLASLYLDGNLLTEVPVGVCLPSLEHLILSSNRFVFLKSYWFGSRSFPTLKAVDLQDNVKLIQIEKKAFSNPSLQSLQLANCGLNLGSDWLLDADSFAGCENLQRLFLSYNRRGSITAARFKQLFGNLTSLNWLELKNVGLDQISTDTFSCLTSVENLSLEDNKLSDLPDGAFDEMTRLTQLWLTRNKISVVRPATFGENTRNRLHRLDISGNPFSCSCDVLWLQQWLTSNPSLFSHISGNYMCANIPDMTVQSFNMAEQACLLSPQTSVFIIVIILLLLSVSTLSILLYRYRWHLRLLLFESSRGKGERWRRLQEEHFLYDVFVSYDSQDSEWVLYVLLPELEGRWGLRLCIHQRDFVTGNFIVENIEESVQASKKIMMIFSENFADSVWCQFELQLCLNHVMVHDDVLLVVLLHDIPSRDLTPAMMAVMQTMTYIEWGMSRDAVAAFWGRLRIALHEIMP